MESNYLAISIGHQSMFLKNVLFKPFLGKGWWEFKHPLLRSGSSSNYWGLTHIQTFFEVRRRKNSEEQENKFLNPDQWSGKGPPESWLAILGCKHAPDFEKIRSSIPELWQGQCIIYAELKPQEACCSPKGITRENLRQKLLIKKLKTHWDSKVICSENCDFGGDRTRNRAIFKKTLAKKAVQRKGQKVLRKSLQTSAE